MKKYKLLKDTPMFKAGTICQVGLNKKGDNNHRLYPIHEEDGLCYDAICKVDEITEEWFAPYLFTTEDGVDIYEGDYYFIVANNSICGTQTAPYEHYSQSDNIIMFSTREAAQKYLEKNTYKEGEWVIATLYKCEYLIKYKQGAEIGCYAYTALTNISKGYWNTGGLFGKIIRRATNEEIETYLIAVAKSKGFKEGVRFKSAWTGRTGTCRKISYINGNLGSDGKIIYNNKNGKWAKIIKEVPEYVELLHGICGFKKGDTAKVIKYINDDYHVYVPNRKSTSVHAPNVSYPCSWTKHSTKEAYDAQFKLPNIMTKVDENTVTISIDDGEFVSVALNNNKVEIKYT